MPTERIHVASIHDIAPGSMLYVVVEGLPVALAHVEGVIYAFSDSCRHEGGPLSSGVLIGHTVTCPWHGWTYDIRTGTSIVPPIKLRIDTYPVEVEGDDIMLVLDWT